MFSPNPTPKNRGRASIKPKLRVVPDADSSLSGGQPSALINLFLLILAIGACFLFYHIFAGDRGSPTVVNADGERVLSPERQAKLEKELEEIDNAYQYALIADVSGEYPCFTCPDGSNTLFLYKGEVWRYGATRKGEKGRYPSGNYGAPNLSFIIQFRGTYSECLKMEKTKIYNYPLLPEARKRELKLFRPPGNANDN